VNSRARASKTDKKDEQIQRKTNLPKITKEGKQEAN